MFEIYLQDASKFYEEARLAKDSPTAKRYYRAAVFHAAGSMEAFLNYIAESLDDAKVLDKHQTAFLNDKELSFSVSRGQLQARTRYFSIEDKLKFLIKNFVKDYDLSTEVSWTQYIEFKKFRDELVHPRDDEDVRSIEEYQRKFVRGFSGTIGVMNRISKGFYGRQLRQKILDLIPN